MNAQEVLTLFDHDQRIAIEFPDARKETIGTGDAPSIVRFVRPAPGMNFIQYSRLEPESMDATIRQQVTHFLPMKQPFTWKVYEHDQPPRLARRLQAHGFLPDGEPGAVMVLDLEAVPPELLDPHPADVRHFVTPIGLEAVIPIMEAVWDCSFNWMRARMGAHLDIPGYLSIYVAYIQDRPASAGWTYFNPGSHFASLWGGSTLEADRGRGLYTAVLAARVNEARRRGYRYAFIEAGNMSRPIVAHHGFKQLTTITDYTYPKAK